MTEQEIKVRRLANQHLLTLSDPQTVIRHLCGMQAQFLSNALHGLQIRSSSPPGMESLVKNWTIRGTVHVFHQEDLPLFLHQGRNHSLRLCDTMETDNCITKDRKQYFADLIVEEIASGTDTRDALKAVCFSAGMTQREAESVFNPWGGIIRALCEKGIICHQVQEKKAFMLCPPFEPMERRKARLELARRYFTWFAPATVKDAAYFFGTTQAEVKDWLSGLPVMSESFQGRTYFSIEHQLDILSGIPECIFLAGFDQLMLGYEKTENLFLPTEHLRGIFNLAGIVMPAVLIDGRVVGKWKRKGKKLSVSLFEHAERQVIEKNAMELWPQLGSIEIITG